MKKIPFKSDVNKKIYSPYKTYRFGPFDPFLFQNGCQQLKSIDIYFLYSSKQIYKKRLVKIGLKINKIGTRSHVSSAATENWECNVLQGTCKFGGTI